MRLICRISVVFLSLAALAIPATQTNHPYRTKYVKDTFGRSAALGTGAGAGISQARNVPHEWGGGVAGFGKSGCSRFGGNGIKNTVAISITSIRHAEPGYPRSPQK